MSSHGQSVGFQAHPLDYALSIASSITAISIIFLLYVVYPFFDFNNIEWLNLAKHLTLRISIALLIFATLLHIARRAESGVFPRSGLEAPFAIHLATAVISVVLAAVMIPGSIAPTSVKAITMILLVGFLYVILYWVTDRKVVENLTRTFLSVGFGITALSIVQWVLGVNSFYRESSRLCGIFWDPNIFARFEVVMIGFVFSILLIKKPRGKERYYYLVYAALALLAILFTLSRSGLATFLFITMVLSFQALPRRYALIAIACLAVLGGAGAYFLSEARTYASLGSQVEASGLNRIVLFTIGVDMIQHHWLIGVGLGNFANALREFYAGSSLYFSEEVMWATGGNMDIHNWIIEVWSEQGIFGVASFIWIFVAALRKLKKTQHEHPVPWVKAIMSGHFLMLLTFLFHGLFYHTFFGQFAFWAPFSLAVATVHVVERRT